MTPQFIFTAHPKDALTTAIPKGHPVMLIASAHWDPDRRRFNISRPPQHHTPAICIDSGGFSAAKRWGHYPWSPQHYIDFIHRMADDRHLIFAASMDYACERGVDRTTFETNLDRIRASLENEQILRSLDPVIPWLGVTQGNSLPERLIDLQLRRDQNLIHPYMGIGSVCGRRETQAAQHIAFLNAHLPDVRWHAFGLDIRTLRFPAVTACLQSWDSYSWTWARSYGPRGRREDRLEGESRAKWTSRLAHIYLDRIQHQQEVA